MTQIAKQSGLAVSTLTRPLKDDDSGVSTLHSTTIEKVVNAFGVEGPGLAVEPRRALLRAVLREDAVKYVGEGEEVEAALRALGKARNATLPWLIKTRALELAGYLPGDVVLVDLGLEPQPGDAVCAQIELDRARGTGETVMRLYEKAGSSDLLMAATLDPAIRKLIAVDDRVAIRGVIVGMVRSGKLAA